MTVEAAMPRNLDGFHLLESLLRPAGHELAAPGNAPIPLGQARAVWLVLEGAVEIFGVPLGDAGGLSRRTHMATVEAGGMLFGLESGAAQRLPFGRAAANRDVGATLVAIGLPGTRLLRVEHDELIALARDHENMAPLAAAVEGWLAALFVQVSRAAAPKHFEALAPGGELTLGPGEVTRTADGVVWVRHIHGASHFLGRSELRLAASGVLTPISDATWLVAEEETEVSGVATANLVRSGVVWESLARFHELLLEHVALEVEAGQRTERERLECKLELDREMLDRAARRMASVLGGEEPSRAVAPLPVGEGSGTDALLAACQQVGSALGIELRAPDGEATGSTLHRLRRICATSRVRYRLVILRDDWWCHDNGPLLAFRESEAGEDAGPGAPVALVPTSPTSYELVDPGDGARQPVNAALAGELAGNAYMFFVPLPERSVGVRDLLRLALRGRQRDVATLVAMGALGGLLGLLVPILSGQIFGRVIPSADRHQLAQMTLALVLAAFAAAAFQVTRSIAVLRLSGKLDGSVQAAVWDRLLALPVQFFRKYTVGDLASRSMGLDMIRNLLLGNVLTSVLGAVFSVFSFGLLFYYSARLALVAVGLVAVLMAVTVGLTFIQIRYQRRLLRLQGKIASLLFGLIHGIGKLRTAAAEARAFSLWSEKYSEQRWLEVRAQRLAIAQNVFSVVFRVLSALTIFAMMGLSLELDLDLADFLAFNAAFGQFQAAALALVGILSSVLSVVPIYERLQPILETPPEVDASKAEVGELSGDVELSHVTFRYAKDGPTILDDVTVQARPGELIALVGPSGSGKSTTLRLLLGFETAEAGGVFYDGQALDTLDIASVRRQIGVVLQTGRPMTGDIFTNIVGSSGLGIEAAWEAARMAGLEEDIKAMPMGMHTVISEGAGTFSGGQQQRLLIARAVVNRPRLLYFDEATSALDNRTQEIVTRSLESLKATRVVVAHRLSTIQNADRIYVMVRGRVMEEGSYDELIEKGGVFAELAARQIA